MSAALCVPSQTDGFPTRYRSQCPKDGLVNKIGNEPHTAIEESGIHTAGMVTADTTVRIDPLRQFIQRDVRRRVHPAESLFHFDNRNRVARAILNRHQRFSLARYEGFTSNTSVKTVFAGIPLGIARIARTTERGNSDIVKLLVVFTIPRFITADVLVQPLLLDER